MVNPFLFWIHKIIIKLSLIGKILPRVLKNCFISVQLVTDAVLGKWTEANPGFQYPVTLSQQHAKLRIQKLIQEINFYQKGNGKKKVREQFINNLTKLFDIAHCKCTIISCNAFGCSDSECELKNHVKCTCQSDRRIPVAELGFIRFCLFLSI